MEEEIDIPIEEWCNNNFVFFKNEESYQKE